MNEQEKFWIGQFGKDYIQRNQSEGFLKSNIALFKNILKSAKGVNTVLELGSNVGINLEALKFNSPDILLDAVEINTTAAKMLEEKGICRNVFNQSLSSFKTQETYDLVFTKTVLIHLNSIELPTAYDILYKSSSRYILLAEYYNPVPDAVIYRGHHNKLFRRDFCSELTERYPDLSLIDYGFVYHNDPEHPLDDITWFLLEK